MEHEVCYWCYLLVFLFFLQWWMGRGHIGMSCWGWPAMHHGTPNLGHPRTIIHLAMEIVRLSNGGETPLLVDHATLCICVYLYICIYIYIYVCVYACVCVCVCVTRIYIYIYVYIYYIILYIMYIIYIYISILSYRSIHQSIRPSIYPCIYLSNPVLIRVHISLPLPPHLEVLWTEASARSGW